MINVSAFTDLLAADECSDSSVSKEEATQQRFTQEVSSLQLCSEWLWNLCSLSSYHPIDTENRVPEYSRMKPHSSGQCTHYRNFTSTSSTVRFLQSTPENCGAAAVKQAYMHYHLAKSYIHSLNCVVSCVDMPHETHYKFLYMTPTWKVVLQEK